MKDFWNKRYSEKNFAYGTKPNAFFAEQLKNLEPGKILLPGEGEGRNAVFAASQGWDVTAFDYSDSGRDKAIDLAKISGVNIDYIVTDVAEYPFPENRFDCVSVIFVHLEEDLREVFHANIIKCLKPGGVLIAEFFAREQIKLNSGGPKNENMLYSLEDIYTDFHTMDIDLFTKESVVLNEGRYHEGKAETIKIVARK